MDANLQAAVMDSPGPYNVAITHASKGTMPGDSQKVTRDELRDQCKIDDVQFITRVTEIPAPPPPGDQHGH